MTDEELSMEFVLGYPKIEKVYELLTTMDLQNAFLAGLKAGRPKWHDLRKNPLDLPTENCTVLIYTDWQGMELKTFFVDTRLFENLTFREVIAWAEIPQFEGE